MKKTRGPVTYTELRNDEVMKDIEGYPFYFVTNQGRILSTKPLGKNYQTVTPSRLREVTLSYGSEKYYYCNIYNENGVRVSLRVHRVVYQHFNSKGEQLKEGYVVDHIDENKLNNHIDNLQQITQKQNLAKHHKLKKSL